jgi:4,5-DOPA dioxygenase extradiol
MTTNLMNPAGAYDDFLATARTHRHWTPADGPLPTLYLSHGAPPLFNDGLWMRCSTGPTTCPNPAAS